MEFDLDPLNVGFEIDPLTGITINSGLVSVEAAFFGSTSITIAGYEAVNVDVADGASLNLFGSELVDIDLSDGISVGIADELIGVGVTDHATTVEVADGLVDVDVAEGTASVQIADGLIDVDLSEGVLVSVGEELVFADMDAGIGISLNDLANFELEIPDVI